MFNLNKKSVTKEGILCYLKDVDVYRHYSQQEVKLKGNILSPLRVEKRPSFGYFVGESGEICFNDFILGSGDFVKFVELKFGLTFFEALSKIVVDFNLTNHFFYKESIKTSRDYDPSKFTSREKILSTANRRELGVVRREWAAYDLAYWEQFGITKAILALYNVRPIKYIFFDRNHDPILADKYAYVFSEFKDKIETIKIYQPFNEKYKWLNNHNDSIWQGWDQLPKEGEKLIITKSLKDVMSIVNVLKISSVSLQSESVAPKQVVLDELYKRFDCRYLLYDNDFDKDVNIGQQLGHKIVKNQAIIQLNIPNRYKSKDFSDLVKNYGTQEANEIFKTCIEMPF